jgi:hypothetical protein
MIIRETIFITNQVVLLKIKTTFNLLLQFSFNV